MAYLKPPRVPPGLFYDDREAITLTPVFESCRLAAPKTMFEAREKLIFIDLRKP
jgi:hypothetical protein